MTTAQLKLADRRLYFKCPASKTDVWREISDEDLRRFQTWIDRYQAALQHNPNEPPLRELGREIYEWLNRSLEKCLERLAGPPPLVLEINISRRGTNNELLFWEVPWEILADDHGFLAANSDYQFTPVRRLGLAQAPQPPSDHRLSLMFMAADPREAVPLAFEAEESAILKAVGDVGLDLTVEESGNLQLLARKLAEEPHTDVLHISCHGRHTPQPALLLETEEGEATAVEPAEFSREIGAPQLVFLSACSTSNPNQLLNSYAARLIWQGFPAVLGWGGSVSDTEATQFAALFYDFLARHNSLVQALALARLGLINLVREQRHQMPRDWHLARLYLGETGGGVLSAGTLARRLHTPEHGHKEFLDAKQQVPVAGRHEFVGRRRPLQTILRTFRRDEKAGVLIQGFGRQGKSSLAARVANRLPDHRLVVIYKFYDADYILRQIREATTNETARQMIDRYAPEMEANPARLYDALRELLQGPFRECRRQDGVYHARPLLLVLDDFEQALEDPTTGRHQVKAEYLEAIQAVVRAFAAGETRSRLLLTCRYVFDLNHNGRDLLPNLLLLPLQPMTKVEAKKQVEAKVRTAAPETTTPTTLVERCISVAQGNPGLQDQLFAVVLQDPATAENLVHEMERYLQCGELPQTEELLAFLKNLAIEHLLHQLTPGETHLLQASTLFSQPVPQPVFDRLADDLGTAYQRLTGFGLWEVFEDLVRPQTAALALNALTRPKVAPLTEAAQIALAEQALPVLRENWPGPRPDAADFELTHLALLTGNAAVLQECARWGLRWLDDNFEYKQAAGWAPKIIDQIDRAGQVPGATLLRQAGDACRQTGDVTTARDFYNRALQAVDAPRCELSPVEKAGIMVSHARLLVQNGEPDAALAVLQPAREMCRQANLPRDEAIALGDIARILVKKGAVDEALKLHYEEMEVYEKLGDTRSKAVTLGDIARILVSKGAVDEALKLHQEMIEVFEKLGDTRSKAVTLGDIARILVKKGAVDEALKLHQERIQVFEKLGDAREKAVTLGDIARILVDKGAVDEALKLHQEMIEVFEKLGDTRSKAVTLGDIARILVKKGAVDEALKLHQERIQVFEKLGDAREKAVTLGDIARILVDKGAVDEALKLHYEEMEVYEKLGDTRSKAVTLGDIARILVSKGAVDEALKLHQEMIEVFEKLGDTREKAVTLGDIARILVSKGAVDEALKLHQERIEVFEKLGDTRSKAVTLGDIARILVDKGAVDEALKLQKQRLETNTRLGDQDGIGAALFDISQIEIKQQDYPAAFDHLSQAYEIFLKTGRLDGICIVGKDLGQFLWFSGQKEEALAVLQRSQAGFTQLGQPQQAQQVSQIIQQLQTQK